jgi:outer membrane protein OmpA-like peptidoglycan-associated protein
MHRLSLRFRLFFSLLLVLPSVGAAQGGPYIGAYAGVAEPTNGNYRAHVETGATAAPYAGYFLNDYVGLHLEVPFVFEMPDNDHRGFSGENKVTTLVGVTAGPVFALPVSDTLDMYVTAQGGGFKGLGGRLNQLAPGFSVGGGIEYSLTHNLGIGVFGRWNRAYMSPHPIFCANGQPGCATPQNVEEVGPADIQWATGGVNLTVSFGEAPPPPPPPPPPAPPPPPPPPAKKKIVLRSVHFDFNKYNIRPDAIPVLDEAVSILKEDATVPVVVEGHTDAIGSQKYNQKLSEQRAESVKKYLVSHGIAASRIQTIGYGKTKPVASNDTEDGRAQNRRVELHVE